MKFAIVAALLAFASAPVAAQTYGVYSANPYAGQQVNPYANGGANLYDQRGNFAGSTNSNRFDPNSVNNPYGRYGSQYSADSINNPYGQYGSRYSPDSPRNPFGQGLKVCGPAGCY